MATWENLDEESNSTKIEEETNFGMMPLMTGHLTLF